jgi:hypothetical protein
MPSGFEWILEPIDSTKLHSMVYFNLSLWDYVQENMPYVITLYRLFKPLIRLDLVTMPSTMQYIRENRPDLYPELKEPLGYNWLERQMHEILLNLKKL